MRLLLDTHVLLWWADGDPRLSPAVRAALVDTSHELHISSVSAFEIATKVAIGKLSPPVPAAAVVARAMTTLPARELPVYIRHGLAVGTLPMLHRDPFDRLVLAQATMDGLTIVTQDRAVRAYPVPSLG